MHTTVYEKSPQFRACWYAYRFANVIAWRPLFDVAHATTGSTNYLLQQFLHYFILFKH